MDTPTKRNGKSGHTRRLSDKILMAFHQSCDQGDYEVAEQLLKIVEMMLARRPVISERRHREMEAVVAGHERLWHLRHPGSLLALLEC
jgi:hypothetical protein